MPASPHRKRKRRRSTFRGTCRKARGRKPVSYVVSSRAGFVVGADIGGSNVRVAAADLFGEAVCDLKRPTAKDGSRAVGVQILEMVTEVIDQRAQEVVPVLPRACGALSG